MFSISVRWHTRTRWSAAVLSAILAMGALCPARAADAPQSYFIKLHRPEKVGDKFDCSVSVNDRVDNIRTIAGQKPTTQSDKTVAQADGTLQVTSVDGKDQPTSVSFTVKKFLRIGDDGKPVVVLPPGSVVTMDSRGPGHSVYVLQGGKLDASQREILDLIFSFGPPNRATDDDVYGAVDPKKIGDTWKPDLQQLTSVFAASNLKFAKGQLDGNVTLADNAQFNGADAIKVAEEVSGKDFDLSTLPPGFKATHGELKLKVVETVPVNIKSTGEQIASDYHVHIDVSGKQNDKDFSVSTTIDRHAEQKWIPIKP